MTENQKLAMVVAGGIGLTVCAAVAVSSDMGDILGERIKDSARGTNNFDSPTEVLIDDGVGNETMPRMNGSFASYAFRDDFA